ADPPQGLERRAQARPAPPRADGGIEARVDEDRLAAAPQHPEVVGHLDLGVRLPVALVAVEELALPRAEAAVADGGHLVPGGGGALARPSLLKSLHEPPPCRPRSRPSTARRAGRTRCGRPRRARVRPRASTAAARALRPASAVPPFGPRTGRAPRPSSSASAEIRMRRNASARGAGTSPAWRCCGRCWR